MFVLAGDYHSLWLW